MNVTLQSVHSSTPDITRLHVWLLSRFLIAGGAAMTLATFNYILVA